MSASNVTFTNSQSYSISVWLNAANLNVDDGYILNLGESRLSTRARIRPPLRQRSSIRQQLQQYASGHLASNSINNNPLFIGWRYALDNDYPGSGWTGDISDIQIYNGALSQSDAEPASIGLIGGIGALALIRRRR